MASLSTLQSAYPGLGAGGFLREVSELAARQGYDPFWLLAVMDFETGGTFDPAARNPNSSATGLIQFLDSTAADLGTSTAALAQMSRSEQLYYVEEYLAPYAARIESVDDLYMAVFHPAAVGKAGSYVLYRAGEAGYDLNDYLDQSGDGTITKGEAAAEVRSRLQGGRQGGGDDSAMLIAPVFAGPGALVAGALISAALGTFFYDFFSTSPPSAGASSNA